MRNPHVKLKGVKENKNIQFFHGMANPSFPDQKRWFVQNIFQMVLKKQENLMKNQLKNKFKEASKESKKKRRKLKNEKNVYFNK